MASVNFEDFYEVPNLNFDIAKLKEDLEYFGYGVIDLGTDNEKSVDYPDFGKAIAENILGGKASRGIALCGTGIGISMAANRFKGIRAALCYDRDTAIKARQHNNANVIAIGARLTEYNTAKQCVEAFLTTDFEIYRSIPLFINTKPFPYPP